jgi:hypothetical protein
MSGTEGRSIGQHSTAFHASPRLRNDQNGNCTRTPFPGNKIPLDRLDPVAQKIMSFYPAPNVPTPPAKVRASLPRIGVSHLRSDNSSVE